MSNSKQNPMLRISKALAQGKSTALSEAFQENIDLRWVSIQLNPYAICAIQDSSIPLQFAAIDAMRNKEGIRLSAFPKGTLFYEMHEDNLQRTCQIIRLNMKVFQHPICFELLLYCLYQTKQEWVCPVLETFAPLTKEQERIWKMERMRSLF